MPTAKKKRGLVLLSPDHIASSVFNKQIKDLYLSEKYNLEKLLF